jgi:hypothetical protein
VIPIELPEVTRVRDEAGDHIEPPCKQSWSEAEKLAWHAAVVACDTGLDIRLLAATDYHGRQLNTFGLTIGSGPGSSGHSAMRFAHAWVFLNGVSTGARAVQGWEGDAMRVTP